MTDQNNIQSQSRDIMHYEIDIWAIAYLPLAASVKQSICNNDTTFKQDFATYFDEKCMMIDAAIENISKQIDALKRLKRALINEVITGQCAV